VTKFPQLILSSLPDFPLISEGDDLVQLILEGLHRCGIEPMSGDILAIAQKIVSKSEGRLVALETVKPSAEAQALAHQSGKDPRLVELILKESQRVLRARPGLIIVEHRLGFVCANAGIDSSNVAAENIDGDGYVLLLPEDPDASARRFVDEIQRKSQVELGVLIIDSHGRAWREGAVGVTIGAAGLNTLLDLRGTPDLFGKPLLSTQVGIADELASAASIMMGQAAEGLPVIHIRGLPYPLGEGSTKDILRPKEKNLFQ
jgi:coenzyme F420-0:L-glutamate ligase/coenzyme F420-1:gamma-L-glutamate ligase